MQQYITQLQAQKPLATGKGPEGMPQITVPSVEFQLTAPKSPEITPNFEPRLETAAERGMETSQEQPVHVETKSDVVTNATTQPVAISTAPTAPKKGSLLGDSPTLTEVDTSNPASMVAYVEVHQKDAPENSSRFLSVLVEKIVKIFSLER
jgi:hypothetical protein